MAYTRGVLYGCFAIGVLIYMIFYNISLQKFENLPYGTIASIIIGLVGVASFYILIIVLLTRGDSPSGYSEDKKYFICPDCNTSVDKKKGICPKCGKNLLYGSNIVAE